MSRSYRKAFITDGYKGSKRRQFCKREANRTIRNAEDVPNGKAYRKFYEPWNICDFKWIVSKNEAWFQEKPWRVIRK